MTKEPDQHPQSLTKKLMDINLFKKRMKKNTWKLYDNVMPSVKQKALSPHSSDGGLNTNPYFIENQLEKNKLTIFKASPSPAKSHSSHSLNSFLAMEEQIDKDISETQNLKYITR